MKYKIDTKLITQFNPCKDRFDNWVAHYDNKKFSLIEFLELENITHRDKLWVALRLMNNDTKVVFALDCSFAAYAYAAAASADAYAADAYAYAAYAAADAYAYAAYAAADAYAADAYAAAAASADAYAATAAAAAAAYADAYAAAADAAYAAAAYAAAADARKQEELRQIEAIIYLMEGE